MNKLNEILFYLKETLATGNESPQKKTRFEEFEGEEDTDKEWEIEIDQDEEDLPIDYGEVEVASQETPEDKEPAYLSEKMTNMTLSDGPPKASPAVTRSRQKALTRHNPVLPFCPFPYLSGVW